MGANSTTQQANKVKKWGFRSAESRGPQSLPGSIGPRMSSALGTSNGFVTICNPSLMGDSTGESPQGRAVWETAFPLPSSHGKEQPPHHSASMHGQGLVTTGSILLGRGPPPCASNRCVLRARLSQGSTIHTSDPFLRISGATRWLGHKCPPQPAIRQGKDHSRMVQG